MSDRDELARDIFLADNSNAAPGLMEKEWDENPTAYSYAHNIADGLITKGYRKPRTIITVEEVAALPENSVVADSAGDVAEKRGGAWCSYETAPMTDHRLAKYAPITVLWEPRP